MPATPAPTATVWIGRLCSLVAILALLADASVHLLMPDRLAATMAASGFDPAQTPTLGVIAFGCALVYAIPSTAVLGAILTTGFLGDAICTHFRLGEMLSPPPIICVVLGVLVWAGLYLREPRMRALLHAPSG